MLCFFLLFSFVISRLIKYFLLIAFLTLQLIAYCQEPVFKQYTTREGLPSNEAHYVLSDSKGYVWICTDGGIARYNANDFKIFSTSNGMPDNTVFEVKEDSKGRIWFRTLANKIGFILNDSVHTIAANASIPSYIQEGRIISFGISANDELFIGKQNAASTGFLKISPPYDTAHVSVLKSQFDRKNGMEIMLLDKKNVVFTEIRERSFGLRYGIKIVNKNKQLLLEDSILHTETFPVTRVCICRNNLLYATKNTLICYDLDKKRKTSQKEDFQILGMGVINDSTLYIGGYSIGIRCYNTNLEPLNRSFLNGVSPTSFNYDFQNGLWISTLESGVYYHAHDDVVKYRLAEEKDATILAMTVQGNSFYLGYSNFNSYKITPGVAQNIQVKKISGKEFDSGIEPASVTGLMPITENAVFISSSGNNHLYEFKTNRTRAIKDPRSTFKSGLWFKNRFILFALSEAYSVDINFSNATLLGKIKDRISDAVISRDTLYVSGLNGLYKYNEKTKTFILDSRCSKRIDDLAENKGTLFLATKTSGLLILNGTRVDSVSEKSGLISNMCKSVLVNNNEIWVASNRGLSKITKTHAGDYDVYNYSIDYFADLVDIRKLHNIGDTLLFFSGNSVYFFNAKMRNPDKRCSVIRISADGSIKDKTKEINLSYHTKEIKIMFEALFYNLKGKILYRYSYGDNWVYTNENEITLASLAPGDYHFRVEALNVNNEWIPAPEKILIRIQKPFWQQAAFIIASVIILALMLSFLFYNINRRSLNREKQKNEISRRMMELESQAARSLMGPHFIFNSLNTLQRFILEADLENAENYLSKFAKMLRKLLENSAADKISLYDEVDILNKYIDIERIRFDKSFDFKVELNVANPRFVNIPFMFIQPFVENAIWHGLIPKEGTKWLSLVISRKDEKSIRCIVEDNGVGRQSHVKKTQILLKEKSLAMDLIKQRLELLSRAKDVNCYYEITDKKNENGNSTGTRIEIVLPIIN
ncbi:MAG: ypdA 5 [Bacteroidetes bacterium]|nr:ypdA 5 [Bacteroidota bacterium]